jgi:hypothetical protein
VLPQKKNTYYVAGYPNDHTDRRQKGEIHLEGNNPHHNVKDAHDQVANLFPF